MKNNYPKFHAKVIIETVYKVSETHQSRNEYIEARMNFITEMDAVKFTIDALRARYYELEQDEV